MAKNLTLIIVDRIERLEAEQLRLANLRVIELAAEGITVTAEEIQQPSITSRAVNEIPTGLVNGINKVFTLKNAPIAECEEVFLEGALLEVGATKDYTISNSTIVLNYEPLTGEVLRVSYQFSVSLD